jgi:DNA repair exonuclease SbcCD ATPase subunit
MSSITEKSRIKVKWEGSPDEFSKEKQSRIKAYFQNKYGCKNVSVVFIPTNANGSEYTLDQSESIYDLANQRKLIEQFITENKIDIPIEDIVRLDEKVNDKMKQDKDVDFTYRKLKIKRIWFDNFLSFGEGNQFPYEDLTGLTIVNSEPKNFGGKTTGVIDLLLYLFFNRTTKTKKDIEIFNIYLPESKEVKVKGLIEISGVEYIIERTITRSGKTKIVTNSQLRICKYVNGIEEDLSEEQRRESEKILVETIGTYEDFLLTIMSTGDNLTDIIDQKPTERGNLLTRFIGLDIIKEKEGICKSIKDEWEKTIKSNQYNIVDLQLDIDTNNEIIGKSDETITLSNKEIDKIISDIKDLDLTKELLLGKKKDIDETLLGLNLPEEEKKLTDLSEKGKLKKDEYITLSGEMKKKTKPEYDEVGHDNANKKEKELTNNIHAQEMVITTKEKEITTIEREQDAIINTKEKDIEKVKSDQETTVNTKEKEITTVERDIDALINNKEKEITTTESNNVTEVQKKENSISSIKQERLNLISSKQKEFDDNNKIITDLKQGVCPIFNRPFENCVNGKEIENRQAISDELDKVVKDLQNNPDSRIKPIEEEIIKIKDDRDKTILKIKEEINTLKTTEDPRITKIKEDIKKIKSDNQIRIDSITKEIESLKTNEDPRVTKIKDEIKNINTVEIPKIQKEQTINDELVKKFKEQSDILLQYEKDKIKVDRLEVEIKGIAQDYRDQEALIKRYNENLSAVDINKGIEKQIIDFNVKIDLKNQEKDTHVRTKQQNEDKIVECQKTIKEDEKLINIIKKEQEVLKIFENYLIIFGKKGISSLILKSSIPLINSELDRLLSDTAEFSLELELNSKNDVEYLMTDRETGLKKSVSTGSGYETTASALALRAVLTKISVLPKPDMIVLDEIFGKVADENLELMKNLIDKISEMFDKVFMITHNNLVKDWGNNIITIEKNNNISSINFTKNITKSQI